MLHLPQRLVHHNTVVPIIFLPSKHPPHPPPSLYLSISMTCRGGIHHNPDPSVMGLSGLVGGYGSSVRGGVRQVNNMYSMCFR